MGEVGNLSMTLQARNNFQICSKVPIRQFKSVPALKLHIRGPVPANRVASVKTFNLPTQP